MSRNDRRLFFRTVVAGKGGGRSMNDRGCCCGSHETCEDPIVVEQRIARPPEELWRAITEPERMRQWYFPMLPDFRPEIGFRTQFTVEHEGRAYIHLWEVREVEPLRRLTYRWQYAGVDGDSEVTWELEADGDATLLRLTHRGISTFPRNDPAFRSEACRAGWEYLVQRSLPEFLEADGTTGTK
ncbi:MAG: SRPBCC domain-containing protein [Planctomycetota bacterium]|nr:MAG: SRPBCC domain-containing protein [Planctomycetota bacterium]